MEAQTRKYLSENLLKERWVIRTNIDPFSQYFGVALLEFQGFYKGMRLGIFRNFISGTFGDSILKTTDSSWIIKTGTRKSTLKGFLINVRRSFLEIEGDYKNLLFCENTIL